MKPCHDADGVKLFLGDAEKVLAHFPEGHVQCVVTSPPYYGLRDYGIPGQIGLEPSVEDYVARLVTLFREVRRVLSDTGTLWLNLGDSYNGYNGNRGKSTSFSASVEDAMPRLPRGYGLSDKAAKNKDLLGVPWETALALRRDGWYLRSDIIWKKTNPTPESVTDRPTRSHEYLFLLTKNARYYYDAAAVAEKRKTSKGDKSGAEGDDDASRNIRSVWDIPTSSYRDAHFATFPPALVAPCIAAGTKPGETVLDVFNGSGTTGLVARAHGRNYVGIDINPEYIELTKKRLQQTFLPF